MKLKLKKTKKKKQYWWHPNLWDVFLNMFSKGFTAWNCFFVIVLFWASDKKDENKDDDSEDINFDDDTSSVIGDFGKMLSFKPRFFF